MGAKVLELLARFKQQLMTDKKKSGVLGGLLLVFLVVAGRAVFSGSQPAAATAASNAAFQAVPAAPPDPVRPAIRPSPETPTAALTAVTQEPAAQKQPPSSPPPTPARPESGGAAQPVRVDDLPRILERDLFSSPAWAKLPPAGEQEADDQNAADAARDGGLWNQLTSALVQIPEARRANLERLNADLKELKLQSTMTGPSPIAYISGRLVRQGDKLNGFSIVRIKDRGVVVRKYGLARELKMP
jgi:hypothetical protein